MSNTARWTELCEKYRQLRERSGDENFRVSRFAMHLRNAFSAACGCDIEYVTHYTYEHGSTARYDKYKKSANAISSLDKNENGWVFGLGIQLEISPQAFPKTVVVCSVDVVVKGDEFDVRSSLYDGVETISCVAPQYAADLKRVAERMFEGLSTGLDASSDNASRPRFGFTSA